MVGADYAGLGYYKYIDLINDGNIINKNIFNKYTLKYDLNTTTSSKLTATAFNDVINLSDYTKDDLEEDKNKNLKGFNINAGTGNDIITGSVGNDTISAGLGSYNEIHFDATKKTGDDVINLVKGERTKLIFKDDVSGQFKFETKGKDVLITVYGQKATSESDDTLIADSMDFDYYKEDDSDKKVLEIYLKGGESTIKYKQYDENGDVDVDLSKVTLIGAEGVKYSFLEAASNTNLAKTNGKTNNIVFSSVDDTATTAD